jgi:23S rRNA (pseudouridine1915-N3)-methyltransferase
MNITLLVISKTDIAYLQAGIDEYCKRLKHYIRFDIEVIPALKDQKGASPDEIKEREAALLLKKLQGADRIVLLDEHGKEFRSVEFANWLQKSMLAGRDIVFVIGGPYGFSPEVYERANAQIALSQMTFSHQMVRLVFVEQIYRAMTILRGEPYHHE